MNINIGTEAFLRNKNAIVTGGSRGIGKAITESLVHLGANVAFLYRSNDDEASKLLNEMNKFHDQLIAIKADIVNENDIKSALSQVNDKFGSVDILINNAGVTDDTLLLRSIQLCSSKSWHNWIH
jgi:3-oxoacyl-[acyl-carrier protein] reductase